MVPGLEGHLGSLGGVVWASPPQVPMLCPSPAPVLWGRTAAEPRGAWERGQPPRQLSKHKVIRAEEKHDCKGRVRSSDSRQLMDLGRRSQIKSSITEVQKSEQMSVMGTQLNVPPPLQSLGRGAPSVPPGRKQDHPVTRRRDRGAQASNRRP